MKHLIVSLCLLGATPATAASLCGVTDPAFLALIAGDWVGDQSISLESLDNSLIRSSPGDRVRLRAGAGAAPTLDMTSAFFDSLVGDGVPLGLLAFVPYDVDRVDDVLDTTDHAILADLLSDTPCGPEALPQLASTFQVDGGVTVEGTVTLIAYFTDRILQVTELELQSADALIYMTATALLRPAGDAAR